MATDRTAWAYRRLYAALLHLYPAPFRRRFAEGMEQTFHDLCRERRNEGRGLFLFALGVFAETSCAIFLERMALLMPSRTFVTRLLFVIAFVLSIPAVAMRLTDEVQWTAFDFVFMGALIFAAGMAYGVISRLAPQAPYRYGTALAIATGFLLIWINGAVGIIGSEDNPANLLYLGVLLVAAFGAVLARFRAGGMARAFFVTAGVQLLVPVIALLVFRPRVTGVLVLPDVVAVLFLNAAFALLFVGSAVLFRTADEAQARLG